MKTFTNENSQKMVDMQEKIFGVYFISIEANLFTAARQCSTDPASYTGGNWALSANYTGGSWALVTDDEETVGFMYPTSRDAYNVSVATNGYDNPAMSAVAFGAALTVMVTNHMSWAYHERGQNEAAQRMVDTYEKVRDFVFELSDSDPAFMDGSAVAGFID